MGEFVASASPSLSIRYGHSIGDRFLRQSSSWRISLMSFKIITTFGSRKGQTGVCLQCEAWPFSCGCFT